MRKLLFILVSLLAAGQACADNFIVDRVYHPYVLPFEREVEWRLTSRQSDEGNILQQRYSFGHSLSERSILEAYIVGSRDEYDNFGVSGYELEFRAQLTEQGQYWADWGVLVELEKQHASNDWEAKAGILTEKEFGRFSLTTNVIVMYEWGETVENEIEGQFKMKYRYRWPMNFQTPTSVMSWGMINWTNRANRRLSFIWQNTTSVPGRALWELNVSVRADN